MIIHANGVFWNFSYERYWLTANVIECVCYFAVPVFFMISGTTLIDYRSRYTTKPYFIKRVQRVLVPFIFWSLIAAVLFYVVNDTFPASFAEVINGILNCQYIGIFWFFAPLFAAYLAVPFLNLIPRENRRQAFGYAIIVGAITISILPLVSNLAGISFPEALHLPVTGGYVLYLLIGYWLTNYELPKKYRYLIYCLGFLGLILHIGGTWLLSYQAGEIVNTFKGYLNFPTIAYSSAIFLGFKQLEQSQTMNKLGSAASKFSGYCFGVYLMQYFPLTFVNHYAPEITFSIAYRILGGFAIFGICLLATYLFKKIPLMKHFVG